MFLTYVLIPHQSVSMRNFGSTIYQIVYLSVCAVSPMLLSFASKKVAIPSDLLFLNTTQNTFLGFCTIIICIFNHSVLKLSGPTVCPYTWKCTCNDWSITACIFTARLCSMVDTKSCFLDHPDPACVFRLPFNLGWKGVGLYLTQMLLSKYSDRISLNRTLERLPVVFYI